MSETQVTTDRVLTVPNALSALRLVGVGVSGLDEHVQLQLPDAG